VLVGRDRIGHWIAIVRREVAGLLGGAGGASHPKKSA